MRTLSTLLLLVGLLCSVVAVAQYGAHRPVYVDIDLISLKSIDGVSESFTADFYFTAFYQDATVTVPANPNEALPSGATYESIALEFVNSQSVTQQYNYIYASATKPPHISHFNASIPDVPGLPWIREVTRFQGTFTVALGLQDFPYDHQEVVLELETIDHPIERVEFVLDPEAQITDMLTSPVGWSLEGGRKTLTTNYYHIFNETYSRADFHVLLRREPEYYLDKVVTGVALLVIMTWCLFALPVEDSNRQTTAATTFLAIIAYQFVIQDDVPKVAYTTRLGTWLNMSVGEVAACFFFWCVEAVIQRAAGNAESDAVEAQKKAKKQGEHQNGATHDAPMEDAKGDADGDDAPEGWWTKWNNFRVLFELFFAACMIIWYIIATPILLKHQR